MIRSILIALLVVLSAVAAGSDTRPIPSPPGSGGGPAGNVAGIVNGVAGPVTFDFARRMQAFTDLSDLTPFWFSPTGNDDDPCSRQAPCLTMAKAREIATSGIGALLMMDPGTVWEAPGDLPTANCPDDGRPCWVWAGSDPSSRTRFDCTGQGNGGFVFASTALQSQKSGAWWGVQGIDVPASPGCAGVDIVAAHLGTMGVVIGAELHARQGGGSSGHVFQSKTNGGWVAINTLIVQDEDGAPSSDSGEPVVVTQALPDKAFGFMIASDVRHDDTTLANNAMTVRVQLDGAELFWLGGNCSPPQSPALNITCLRLNMNNGLATTSHVAWVRFARADSQNTMTATQLDSNNAAGSNPVTLRLRNNFWATTNSFFRYVKGDGTQVWDEQYGVGSDPATSVVAGHLVLDTDSVAEIGAGGNTTVLIRNSIYDDTPVVRLGTNNKTCADALSQDFTDPRHDLFDGCDAAAECSGGSCFGGTLGPQAVCNGDPACGALPAGATFDLAHPTALGGGAIQLPAAIFGEAVSEWQGLPVRRSPF